MLASVWDAFTRFEAWFLGVASRPTVAILFAVFVALAVVTWFGRPWSRSLRAWFWFSVANAVTWAYFYEAARIPPEWRVHVGFVLAWWLLLSGFWLVSAMFGRFVLGWEDRPAPPVDVLSFDRRMGERRRGWQEARVRELESENARLRFELDQVYSTFGMRND